MITKASVRAVFPSFSAKFEGEVPWMYLDILGLVTVAIGNLVDPMPAALSLPFLRPDGVPATREEIAAEWTLVKNHPTAAKQGHRALERVTKLRLSREGIEEVVRRKLAEIEGEFRKRFGVDVWESMPADAQLATLSMAWACGAWFRFPRLEAALRAGDYLAASKECHIDTDGRDHIPNTADDNNGVKPRNAANVLMYRNAAHVVANKLDPEELYYPRDLHAEERLRREAEDGVPTERNPVPSRRPPSIEDFAEFVKVSPVVPLGRPSLDGELPTTPIDPDDQSQ